MVVGIEAKLSLSAVMPEKMVLEFERWQNLREGSGSSLSAMIFGNFNDLIIGEWGSLDLIFDPFTNSTTGTMRVTAFMDVDVAVRHTESFAAIQDMVTA